MKKSDIQKIHLEAENEKRMAWMCWFAIRKYPEFRQQLEDLAKDHSTRCRQLRVEVRKLIFA
jgi:hypothetical protein